MLFKHPSDLIGISHDNLIKLLITAGSAVTSLSEESAKNKAEILSLKHKNSRLEHENLELKVVIHQARTEDGGVEGVKGILGGVGITVDALMDEGKMTRGYFDEGNRDGALRDGYIAFETSTKVHAKSILGSIWAPAVQIYGLTEMEQRHIKAMFRHREGRDRVEWVGIVIARYREIMKLGGLA